MGFAILWKMELQFYGKMLCNFREKCLAKNTDKVVELDYIDSISHEAVRRVLKKTKLSLGNAKGG